MLFLLCCDCYVVIVKLCWLGCVVFVMLCLLCCACYAVIVMIVMIVIVML